MKFTSSKLAIALAASTTLFSTTAATWNTEAPYVASTAIVPEVSYSETPASANRFVDSIGVDASYENHAYPSLVTQELEWSGIRHLRDGGTISSENISIFAGLGKHGIYHSIGLVSGFAANDLRSRLAAFAPYIEAVEPANEADNTKHPSWSQMRSDQKNLWNILRSNRSWNGITVQGPSFANPGAHAQLVGPLDSYEDVGVLHNSTCDWNPGTDISYVSIEANTAKIRPETQYKPIWTTETGFGDNLARGCSLPDDIIAKYIPRTSTERWLHGEPRTYLTILADRPSDITFGSLGLLRVNGVPKPQFLALGNLVRLLADPGSAPKTTHVSFSLAGTTSDVHHILLARRDGTFDLLIYREVPSWDHHSRKRISVGTDKVTLTVPNMKHAAIYKYNSSYSFGLTALSVNSRHQTAAFAVTDAISVVHFGF